MRKQTPVPDKKEKDVRVLFFFKKKKKENKLQLILYRNVVTKLCYHDIC